jgi:hypothetical protein
MSKYKCEHGKNKYFCKECGGSQICIHSKNKAKCKECGGSQIYIHNKQKTTCKECKGSGFCIHDKQQYICVECNGNGICKHKLRKTLCDECGGSGLCIHKKQTELCKDCGNNTYEYLCQHNKNKYYCKDCGNNTYEYLCQHNKNKYYCKECGGTRICTHNKNIQYCKECGGDKLCKNTWCEITGNQKYNGYCLVCYVNMFPNEHNVRNYKTKEKYVVDHITQIFTNFTWVADKKVQDACSRRRPDLLLDMGSHIIIVEVDENKHIDYDCSCENKRLMELSQDLQHRPIVFIRFNPDDYTNQDGILVKSCWKLNKLGVIQITKTKQKEWEERMETLKQQIQYWIDNPTEKTIEIIELFY